MRTNFPMPYYIIIFYSDLIADFSLEFQLGVWYLLIAQGPLYSNSYCSKSTSDHEKQLLHMMRLYDGAEHYGLCCHWNTDNNRAQQYT